MRIRLKTRVPVMILSQNLLSVDVNEIAFKIYLLLSYLNKCVNKKIYILII